VVAVDAARNTPLHILVTKINTAQDRQAEMARILQLFVEAGAHLDAVNAAGQTAAMACKLRKLLNIIPLKPINTTFSLCSSLGQSAARPSECPHQPQVPGCPHHRHQSAELQGSDTHATGGLHTNAQRAQGAPLDCQRHKPQLK